MLTNFTRTKARNITRLAVFFNKSGNVLNASRCFSIQRIQQIKSQNYLTDSHILNSVYGETGSINPVPKWYRFGILKVLLCVTSFVLLGSYISQSTAEFLEDNEIFVPEDDDD